MIPFQEIERLSKEVDERRKQIVRAISNIVFIHGGELMFPSGKTYGTVDKNLEPCQVSGFRIAGQQLVAYIFLGPDDSMTIPVVDMCPEDLLSMLHEQIKDVSEERQEELIHECAAELAWKDLQGKGKPESDDALAASNQTHFERLSTLYATRERFICATCGKSNVVCDAVVNPNTKEVFDYVSEAFYHANCGNCHGQVLVDVVELHSEIDSQYKEFVEKQGREPESAYCWILRADRPDNGFDNDPTEKADIRLCGGATDDPDELRCDGIAGLKMLAFPDEERGVTLVELIEFC